MKDITLLYPNYFYMAEQHLKACKEMLKSCSDETPFYVYHDIYYLCGYILEGFVIYSIFKLYNYEVTQQIDESWKDKVFTRQTNLQYYRDKHSYSRYYISGHKFQEYVNLLHCQSIFKDIEFFGPTEISDSDVQKLVDGWNPKIRYDFSSLSYCTYDSVKKLLDFCHKAYRRIYNQLEEE